MLKILVIRFSSIGDIVLTSPILRCLKKQLSGVEVHYLTKAGFKDLLLNNPNVDKVYSIQKHINEILSVLKTEQYDYIIDLHHNLRSWQVKTALGKKSFAFDKLNFEKWLIVNFKINRLPQVHIVDRYFETVKSLGVTNDGLGLDYFIKPIDEVAITSLPETHRNGFVAIVIGAKHFTKRLPDEKIIEIIHQLNKPVVLLGGKEDRERGKLICEKSGSNCYNACGKYSLDQSASIIRQSDVVITNDTGLMHIAAAFKKKIISVWGNTIPEFGMTPYFPVGSLQFTVSKIVEVKGLSCRPCSKIGYDKCPKGHFRCMNELNVAEIVDSVKELN